MRKKFECKECGTQLIAANYTNSLILVFGLWGFLLSPVIWVLMCCGVSALVADIVGLVLAMGIVGPSVIELKVQSEAL